MNLYELTEQYQDLLDLAAGGAPSEDLEVMLDGLEDRLEDKIEKTACVVRSIDLHAAAVDEEIKRLQARKSSMLNNAEYLKSRIETSLNVLGKDKMKTPLFNIGMVNNPPKVVVVDEFSIPETYFHTPQPQRSLMRAEIAKAWKGGQPVPGTQIVQDKRLSIK